MVTITTVCHNLSPASLSLLSLLLHYSCRHCCSAAHWREREKLRRFLLDGLEPHVTSRFFLIRALRWERCGGEGLVVVWKSAEWPLWNRKLLSHPQSVSRKAIHDEFVNVTHNVLFTKFSASSRIFYHGRFFCDRQFFRAQFVILITNKELVVQAGQWFFPSTSSQKMTCRIRFHGGWKKDKWWTMFLDFSRKKRTVWSRTGHGLFMNWSHTDPRLITPRTQIGHRFVTCSRTEWSRAQKGHRLVTWFEPCQTQKFSLCCVISGRIFFLLGDSLQPIYVLDCAIFVLSVESRATSEWAWLLSERL